MIALREAKAIVDELVSLVTQDGGQWLFKHREGRNGAKLMKESLMQSSLP